jgi:NAD(P)-dependent dehydrogenase (short-subunit alcohol dehydrogenase family)
MNYNPYSLEGKTVLITGASSGIGRTLAIECSKMGAKLVITARNEERLTETLGQLVGEGHEKIIADLTVMEELENLVNVIPQVDGLVNNAGIIKMLPVQFLNENDLGNMLKTNTFAPVLLTQRIFKKKKLNKKASIVFTSSTGGIFNVTPGNSMYSMSKGAIDVFMKFAALEMAQKEIRCNCVNPGMVETQLLDKGTYSLEEREKNISKYPLKRYGQPKDIALGIIYLLSDAASWVTGTNLIIDGGLTI